MIHVYHQSSSMASFNKFESHWIMSMVALSTALYALSSISIEATKKIHYEYPKSPQINSPMPINSDHPTPKCTLSEHLPQNDGEPNMVLEEPPTGKHQWHSMDSSPMEGKQDEFWNNMMKRIVDNGGHDEDEHSTMSQDTNMEEKQRDPGYELVNHRFWNNDIDGHRDQRTHLEDQNNNWQTWTKLLSYFPSGQEQLSRHGVSIGSSQQQKQPNHVSIPNQVSRQQAFTATIEDASKDLANKNQVPETPAIAMIIPSKKSADLSELDQQDQMRLLEPITMHFDDKDVRMIEPQQVQSIKQFGDTNQGFEVEPTTTASPPNSQRFRDSLLKAADNARHLTSVASNSSDSGDSGGIQTRVASNPALESSNSTFAGSGAIESFGGSIAQPDYRRQFWSPADQIISWNDSTSNATTTNPLLAPRRGWQGSFEVETFGSNEGVMSQGKAKFLGYGQLQRNDPFNGNGRTQARLSCQFSDGLAKNMSISNVEWAKFVGNYNADKEEPDFECLHSDCRLVPIKTDVLTTVHPRPAIQNYINTLAPSYSMTLHEVDHNHHGVYRCSALRQTNEKTELVYRIIPFE